MKIKLLILCFSIIINSQLFCMENDKKDEVFNEQNSGNTETYNEEDLNILADVFLDLVCKIHVHDPIQDVVKKIKSNKDFKIIIDELKRNFSPSDIREIFEYLSIKNEDNDYDSNFDKFADEVIKKNKLIHKLFGIITGAPIFLK